MGGSSIGSDGFEVDKYDTIGDVCERYSGADYILIDIPVGLRNDNGQFRPDGMVRKKLGRKGASIFDVPCRQAVYADDKPHAKALNKEILGKSLSEQSLGFSKAIRQVDGFCGIIRNGRTGCWKATRSLVS